MESADSVISTLIIWRRPTTLRRSVTAAGAQRTTGVQNPGSNRGLATSGTCSSGLGRRDIESQLSKRPQRKSDFSIRLLVFESISVVGDSFREKQRLQPPVVAERRLDRLILSGWQPNRPPLTFGSSAIAV